MSSADKAAAPTILFVLYPEFSVYNSSFALARQLKQLGFSVLYVGFPKFQHHVTAQGFQFSVPEALAGSEYAPEGYMAPRSWRARRERTLAQVREYVTFLQVFDEWLKPRCLDAAVLDFNLWRLAPPLLKRKIPVAQFTVTFASVVNLKSPPVFTPYLPAANRKVRDTIRNTLAWLKLICRTYRNEWTEDLLLLSSLGPFEYRRCRARTLVKAAGGVLTHNEYGFWLDVPTLVTAPRELDFPATAAGRNRIYAGPSVDAARDDGTFNWSALDPDKPLLYCSLGTYSHCYPHSRRFFQSVVAFLRNNERWQGVLHVGSSIGPEDFGPLPNHILVAARVPQLELLRRASVFLTHAGPSSVREAVYAGTPMLTFPCWLDQEGTAARVVYHGLGLRADISTIDSEVLERMLNQLSDETYLRAVRRMQGIFRSQEAQEGGSWIAQCWPGNRFMQAAGQPRELIARRILPCASS